MKKTRVAFVQGLVCHQNHLKKQKKKIHPKKISDLKRELIEKINLHIENELNEANKFLFEEKDNIQTVYKWDDINKNLND